MEFFAVRSSRSCRWPFSWPSSSTQQIERSPRTPAFSARDLTQPPRRDWITNGGNVFNQRYSPLTQINRDNVERLKPSWRIALNGSGHREQVLGPGAAARARRRDLHGHGRERRVRDRRRHRRDPLDVSRASSTRRSTASAAAGRAAASRSATARSIVGAARRQARRARSAHRQGRVVDAGGALAGRASRSRARRSTTTAS